MVMIHHNKIRYEKIQLYTNNFGRFDSLGWL